MVNTSSNLPVCVFCGTPRPADETLCPKCGKPWIDVSVGDAEDAAATGTVAASAAAAAATGDHQPTASPPPAGIDDTGEFDFDSWSLPPEPKPSRARWLIPIVLLIGAVVLWSFVFVNRDSAAPPTTVVALETTTTQQATTSTTQPSNTTATTDTTTTTTTAPVYPPADSWESIGDPIPIAELGLRASGIGPIAFGSPLTETAGALVASLGSAQMSGYDNDQCASEEWYWITWGDLRAIFDGYDDDATFIGYRYENADDQPSDPILETLSGIRLGDTVASPEHLRFLHCVVRDH